MKLFSIICIATCLLVYFHLLLFHIERRIELAIEAVASTSTSTSSSSINRINTNKVVVERILTSSEDGTTTSPRHHDRYRHAYNCSRFECAPRDLPACSWSYGAYWSSSSSPYEAKTILRHVYTRLIRLFNALGLRYYAYGGTGLGAYRNGGVIPGDQDVDIVVPVWLNEALFGGDGLCDDARRSPPRLRDLEHSDESLYTLCNRTRREWVTAMGDAIRRALRARRLGDDGDELAAAAVQVTSTGPHNLRLTARNVGSVDVVASIWDWQLLQDEHRYNQGLCRCEFSGVEAISLERLATQLHRHYGPTFMTTNMKSRANLANDNGVFPLKPFIED